MTLQNSAPPHVIFDPIAATGLALAAAFCLVAPIVTALWWHRRSGAPLRAFGIGALVFFVSQVVLRLPWQIPLGRWVQAHSEWLVPFLLFSSLTAALFEETGRLVGYKHLLAAERTRRVAIMFGLGHGALEAILLAGLPLAGLLVSWMLAAQGRLPSAAADAIQQQTAALDFWKMQLAALERASAIAVHVGLALVVLQVWKRGGLRWLILAILLHFSINAVAALLVLKLQLSPWIGELVLVVMAAAVLSFGLRLARAERQS
jgi:uncharacterized membrane protein YhfC